MPLNSLPDPFLIVFFQLDTPKTAVSDQRVRIRLPEAGRGVVSPPPLPPLDGLGRGVLPDPYRLVLAVPRIASR